MKILKIALTLACLYVPITHLNIANAAEYNNDFSMNCKVDKLIYCYKNLNTENLKFSHIFFA